MKIFTSKTTWNTATLQTIGSMFLVITGNNKKMFDNQTTAINYTKYTTNNVLQLLNK